VSDVAYEGAEPVSIHGSALEPAEPITTEGESQTQTAPQTNEERIAELENPYSDEFLEGWKQAKLEDGYEEVKEPGDEGYIEWAQSELAAMDQQLAEGTQALNGIVEQALAQGNYEVVEQATAWLENLNAQVEQAEFERQERAYQEQAMLEGSAELFQQAVADTEKLVGAEGIDPQHVLDISAETYQRLSEQFGPETANALAEEVVQKTVAHLSNEIEEGTAKAYEAAASLAKDLGNGADPAEIVSLASELYQRELYRAGGDQVEANRSALMQAAKVVGGFSEKSQPRNMVSVAAFHASLNDALPREQAPQPEHKVQLQRDQNGRFVAKTNAAADHAAKPPKSEAERIADAQKEALKNAFAALNVNR